MVLAGLTGYGQNVNANEPPALNSDAFQYPHSHDKIDVVVPLGREQAYIEKGGRVSSPSFCHRPGACRKIDD